MGRAVTTVTTVTTLKPIPPLRVAPHPRCGMLPGEGWVARNTAGGLANGTVTTVTTATRPKRSAARRMGCRIERFAEYQNREFVLPPDVERKA